VREELIERDRNYYLVDSLLEANVPVLTHKSNWTPHEDRPTHQAHQGVCLLTVLDAFCVIISRFENR